MKIINKYPFSCLVPFFPYIFVLFYLNFDKIFKRVVIFTYNIAPKQIKGDMLNDDDINHLMMNIQLIQLGRHHEGLV